MFWGASLMWLVDAVFAYAEQGAACFTPAPAELLDGLFLGLSVMALALVIWLAALLIRTPRGFCVRSCPAPKNETGLPWEGKSGFSLFFISWG